MTDSSTPASSAPSSGLVLVVDDDPVSRLMVSHMITNCHHETMVAGSVDEAEQLLARHEVDVVVCDYLMPDRTGLDLVGICAERSIPFILLTGFAEDGHLVDSRTDLVAAHLTKPVSTAELSDTIDRLRRAAVEGPRGPAGPQPIADRRPDRSSRPAV